MSEGNESALRFSLEESVWFQKGQEVSELISISLVPDITIHENDHYVTIEGSLQLSGEYRKHEAKDNEEDFPSSPKFIQTVEQREEDVFEFMHHFPVDITIPVNRVRSIEEVNVEIDSFDYHLPEKSCLKLVADLTISGLYGEQQQTAVEDDEEEVPVEIHRPSLLEKEDDEMTGDQEEKNDLFAPFSAEARKKPEKEETVKTEKETSESVEEQKPYPLPIHVEDVEKEISFSARKEESSTFEDLDMTDSESESADNVTYESDESTPVQFEDLESSSSPPGLSIKKNKKKSKKDGISLAKFFARKEEDEEVTRLKVCIVQSGETVDSIAERYEVSAQSILRVNDMDMNQDVYGGQVLYIPEHIVHK